MARMNTEAVSIHLYGHGLECAGNIVLEPKVTGNFEAETVTGADGIEYAVFTIPDNPDHSGWTGTYRISVERLKCACKSSNGTYNPDIFEEV